MLLNEIFSSIDRHHPYPTLDDPFEVVVLATPQMMSRLAEAVFLQADVTFPEMRDFRYLLNLVTFNYETLLFQTVARVLMNNLSSFAYKFAFSKVFEIATVLHPEFEKGQNLKAVILDFSTAQREGLSEVLGENSASKTIRGCEVHYQRNVKKVADKICVDKDSKEVFKKIAYKIPYLEHQEDVTLAFTILTGKAKMSLPEAKKLLIETVGLTKQQLTVDSSWSKATDWAKFWQRPKIAKMFTKAFKEMCDADWEICAKTTNAVESQNKLSKVDTSALLPVLESLYSTDRQNAYREVAVKNGISTGVSEAKRTTQNKKKSIARKKPKVKTEEDEDVLETSLTDATSSATVRVFVSFFCYLLL